MLRPIRFRCDGVRFAAGLLCDHVVSVVAHVTSQFDRRRTFRDVAVALVEERLYFIFLSSVVLVFCGGVRIMPITLCRAVLGLRCLLALELWDHGSASRSGHERTCLLYTCVALFRRGLTTSRSPSRDPARYLSTGFINQENEEPWVAADCS